MKNHISQPVFHFHHSLMYTSILMSLGLLTAAPLLANPKGGEIVGGQATITQNPGITTIDQTSDRAIINWQNFSIGRGDLTRFNQPDQNATALNRVLGNDPSNILGQLQANGHVWLVNPNGILIGPGARVNVQGLLATTADIADRDFLEGRDHFSMPSPNPDASVVNQGVITIGQHGFGGLVAPHVRNSGVITGRLGQVVIAGAPTFTLDYYGDGLIQFAATSRVSESADPSRALVENDGTISVDGGNILLTANAAANVVEAVINTSGIIEARSFAVEDGVIALMGGDEGMVNVAGRLDASGAEPGGAGGSVDVLGNKVLIAESAHINTSGSAGGGTVHIGGDLRGQGGRQRANQTTAMAGALITADATQAGNGGQVVVWADNTASIHGEISAKGGAESGDGGFIETSGKNHLDITSTPDASSANGEGGTWLIDPADITIVSEGDTAVVVGNVIFSEAISKSLSSGTNVILDTSSLPDVQAEGNISQRAGATITMENLASDSVVVATLTLNAENSISLDDTITVYEDFDGGGFDNAQLNVILNADSDDLGGGAVVMGSGSHISTNGGDVLMSGVGTTKNRDGINFSGATINSANGNIGLTGAASGSGGYSIVATNSSIRSGGTTTLTAGAGDIYLGDSQNDFNKVVINSAGSVSIADFDDIELGNSKLAGTLAVRSDTCGECPVTGITVSGQLTAGDTIWFDAQDDIEQTVSSTMTANLLVVETRQQGEVRLNGNNKIPRLTALIGGSNGSGTFELQNNQDLVVVDAVESLDGESFFPGGITAGAVRLEINGTLTLAAPIVANSEGDAIVIHANGFNNATPEETALQVDAGRFLVYSENTPEGDVHGNLDDISSKIYDRSFETDPPATITEIGNLFLYELQAVLNVIANNFVVEYGDPIDLTGYIDPAGLIEGDTLEDSISGEANFSLSPDLRPDVPVSGSPYVIQSEKGTLESPLGYQFNFVNGELTITPAPLTAAVNDASREYGDSNPTFDVRYDGFKLGQDESVLGNILFDTPADEASPVAGSPYPITMRGFENTNYVLNTDSIASGDLTITPAPLSISVNDASREYGDPNPAFDARYEGFKLGQDESVLGDIAIDTTADEFSPVAGNSYAIIMELAGIENTNYELISVTEGILTITPAPLSILVSDAGREYGDQNPAFDARYEGFKLGQDESVLGDIAIDTTADEFSPVAGSPYAISVTGVTNTNYLATVTEGELTITPAPLGILVNDSNREYGDPNPLFDASYTGFKLGQDETVLGISLGSPADEASPVADSPYAISVTSFTNTNYLAAVTDGELNITPAPLSVSVNDASREYGDPNPVFDASYAGFKLGQDEAVLGISLGTAADQASPVAGSPYTISVTGFTNTNYLAAVTDGDLTITPAPLRVSVDDANREYGDPNPLFDASYAGFKLGQDESVLGDIVIDTTADEFSSVAGNPYAIIMELSGIETTNYELISVTDGKLTIKPAPLGILVNAANREYGDPNPAFGARYEGFKLGQDATVLGISLGTAADETSPVAGSPYAISVTSFNNTNYLAAVTDGELTITPAPLGILVNDANREYGDPNPVFGASYEGFKLGQDESVLGDIVIDTMADEFSPVAGNPYAIVMELSGIETTNYELISVTDGKLTITPAPLGILVNDANREYGDPNPAFGSRYDGFKLGQDETVLGISLGSPADETSPVAGSPYAITVTGFTNTNYLAAVTDGDLTITPAPLGILVNDANREYGNPNPAFDARYDGFKLGQDETVLGISLGSPADETSQVAGSPYAITVTGFTNTNYLAAVTDGELNITPAPLSVSVNDASREYGDPNPVFDASYSGFKLGQDKAVLGTIAIDTTAKETSPVNGNPYPIFLTGFESTNYVTDRATSTDGELTIKPAPLTIAVVNKKRGFGEENPVFTLSYKGFKLGEDSRVISGLVVESDAKKQSRPGNYGISTMGATASNYSIQLISGTLEVSIGDIPGADINIVPKILPEVPLGKLFESDISAIPARSFAELYGISGIEFLTQRGDQQLNPELNRLLDPSRNQQGNQQDDLLYSNDGNHDIWGR